MSWDRRVFIQTVTAALTSIAFNARSRADGESPSRPAGRITFRLNKNWRYSRLHERSMLNVGYDDSSFENVTLPHANVNLPWHQFDQTSYQFVSIYRRELRLPETTSNHRIFLDFDGVMTSSTLWVNGVRVGEYKGGYTPFSFELTNLVNRKHPNLIAVEVDSRELPEVPPFGYQIDYLTFGGIYREVSLRCVPSVYIENIFASPSGVSNGVSSLTTVIDLDQSNLLEQGFSLEVTLFQGDHVVAHTTQKLPRLMRSNEIVSHTIKMEDLTDISAWELDNPTLYEVRVSLLIGNDVVDQDSRRVGFRTAVFTDRGFELNGRIVKIRGLNRHQTYPYVGGAMPARVQRRDAEILKKTLKCNMVRTSHYPQSPHFLDACDELGLLVLEEIPGWQHVGDQQWQDLAVDNVRRMIRRDRNRPSIVLWSIRINESRDYHDFYKRTNNTAHNLDPSRQTCGVRYFQDSELLEDVFCMNDFQFPLKLPNHPRYLNTEFVGAEWPVRSSDNNAIQREHVLRYARIYNQLGSDPAYAGGLGWCAFDYNTHADFGSGDHVCYMGVMDMFREPKAAAGFYKSQCDPSDEIVLEPAFHFADNDEPSDFKNEVICSNCDLLRCFIRPLNAKDGEDFKPIVDLHPAQNQFPYLAHPPFFLTLPNGNDDWGDLRIEGYIQGKKVITKTLSGSGSSSQFELILDDHLLLADGSDATRVVLRVVDSYGSIQRLCADPVQITLDGPATLVGPPFVALIGGTIAFWVRAQTEQGVVSVTALHPSLGIRTATITMIAVEREYV